MSNQIGAKGFEPSTSRSRIRPGRTVRRPQKFNRPKTYVTILQALQTLQARANLSKKTCLRPARPLPNVSYVPFLTSDLTSGLLRHFNAETSTSDWPRRAVAASRVLRERCSLSHLAPNHSAVCRERRAPITARAYARSPTSGGRGRTRGVVRNTPWRWPLSSTAATLPQSGLKASGKFGGGPANADLSTQRGTPCWCSSSPIAHTETAVKPVQEYGLRDRNFTIRRVANQRNLSRNRGCPARKVAVGGRYVASFHLPVPVIGGSYGTSVVVRTAGVVARHLPDGYIRSSRFSCRVVRSSELHRSRDCTLTDRRQKHQCARRRAYVGWRGIRSRLRSAGLLLRLQSQVHRHWRDRPVAEDTAETAYLHHCRNE